MTNEPALLHPSAITLAIELCGNIDLAIELLGGDTKAAYWQGIKDAIKAQNRIAERQKGEGNG